MRRNVDPPFYPGEIVTGRVLRLEKFYAVLDVRGWKMRLEKRLMSWQALRHTSELFSIGDKIDVMIQTDGHFDPINERHYLQAKSITFGYWLSRLPLLDNPWPGLIAKYPEGAVVEVEMVDYTALHTVRARFPEGLLVEVPLIGLVRHARRNHRPLKPIFPGERFKIMVRGTMPFNYWLQPYFGKADRVDGLVA